MKPDTREPARNVLPDLIIPALAVAFVVYYWTTITEVPWISQASAVFVGVLLLLAIAAWAVRTVGRIRRGVEYLGTAHLLIDGPTQVKRIVLLALTVGYLLVLEVLGFTLTTFAFLFAAILILSSARQWRTAAAVAAGCALAGYLIFVLVFETRFPEGWFERVIGDLVS